MYLPDVQDHITFLTYNPCLKRLFLSSGCSWKQNTWRHYVPLGRSFELIVPHWSGDASKGSEGLHGCCQLWRIQGQNLLNKNRNSFTLVLAALQCPFWVTHPVTISAERDNTCKAVSCPKLRYSSPVGKLLHVCSSPTRRTQVTALAG